MSDGFDKYKTEFIEETEDHLVLLNDDLIELEQHPQNQALINNIFRILHTLKSSAASVGYGALGQLAHQTEDLIQLIKNGDCRVSRSVMDILFEVYDEISDFIRHPVDAESYNWDDLIQRLGHMAGKQHPESSGTKAVGNLPLEFKLPKDLKKYIREAKTAGKKPCWIQVRIDPMETIQWMRAKLVLYHLEKAGEILQTFPEREQIQQNGFHGCLTVLFLSDLKPDAIRALLNIDLLASVHVKSVQNLEQPLQVLQPENPSKPGQGTGSAQQDRAYGSAQNHSIRVSVKKLDALMHLVGELVVTNSGLKMVEGRIRSTCEDKSIFDEMNGLTDQLVKISSRIQSTVLKARMIPVKSLFHSFRRVVRDLCQKEGKKIEFIILGEETELDKKVINAMGEPLTHLIRNSVDHGIEPPEERVAKGKPEKGSMTISASQTGNHITITISDDGRGIDLEKVRHLAIQKGFIAEDIQISEESDIMNLIFETGFSTSRTVSSLSGRGIGLDVVRKVITGLNGSVQVSSHRDIGTQFTITLPLTLAINSILLVECQGKRYGIPMNEIRESIKMNTELLEQKNCIQVINLGGRVLPVVGLQAILDQNDGQVPMDKYGETPIIIVNYGEREVGIMVDRILGKQEIVLKPLEEHYKSIQGVSGAAVLGDGSVILVMDIHGVIGMMKQIEQRTAEKESVR